MSKQTLDLTQSVYTLCREHPLLADILREAGFSQITQPGMLETAGRFMTIPKGAAMRKISLADVIGRLEAAGFAIAQNKEEFL